MIIIDDELQLKNLETAMHNAWNSLDGDWRSNSKELRFKAWLFRDYTIRYSVTEKRDKFSELVYEDEDLYATFLLRWS